MAENLKNRYITLHKSLQLLEKTNVDKITEMKLIAVTEIEEKYTITSLKKKKMLQDMRVFPIKILKHCVNLISLLLIYTLLH
jgi:hypothetical protein